MPPRTRARRPSLGVEQLENRTTPALIGLEATDIAVSTDPDQGDGSGDVAMRIDGSGFVVTYQTPDGGGGGGPDDSGVFFKRYDANWQLVQGPIRVNTTTLNDQQIPAIGMDAAGNFVVAWQSFGQDGDGATTGNIYARRFLADGTAIDATEFRVNTTTAGQQRDPDVAANASGQFVITYRSGLSTPVIFAQAYAGITVGGSGTPTTVGGESRVDDGVSGDGWTLPAVAIDGTGDYVVAFQTHSEDDGGLGSFGIAARLMNQNGTPNGAQFRVNTVTAGDQNSPDIAMDGGGNFNIVWHSVGVDGSGTAVVMQRYNAAGVAQGGNVQVNTGITTNNQFNAHAAATPAGTFLVTWTGEEMDVDNNGSDVYYKLYNSAGAALVGDRAVSPTTVSNDAGEDNAVGGINAAGDFVVQFDSGAGSTFDTYLRRFAEDADVDFTLASSAAPESANAAILMTRSGAPYVLANVSNSVTVNVAGGGTATAGTDFTAGPYTVVFPADGSTTKNLTFNVTNDAADEPDETINLSIGGVTNGTAVGQTTHTYTIQDDDAPPTLSVSSPSATEGNSGTTTLTFTVTLSAASSSTVTVDYATADGTATTADGDYVAASNTLTFTPGQTSRTVSVTVNGDTKFEANETLTLTLSNPTNATIATGTGTGTITNDDTAPTLSVNDASVTETDGGAATVTFTVTLSAASGVTATVDYATANNTATAGSDYVAASNTLTFAPGQTSQTVSITVNGDALFEGNESFFLNLSNAGGATISDGQGVGTVTDNDAAASIAVVSGNNQSTVINTDFDDPLVVEVRNAGGTLVQGVSVVFTAPAAGASAAFLTTTNTITVGTDASGQASTGTVAANGTAGANYTVTAQAVGGTAPSTNFTLTNLPPTNLSIDDVSVTEGDSGTKTLTFTVTANPANGLSTVAVDWATANSTAATADGDYVAASGTLVFAPGVTTQTVSITINGDTTNEADETFFVNLSNATNAAITDGQGVGTITNDDPVPTLSINDMTLAEGDGGPTAYTFAVTLSAVSGQTVTVNYATADDTATAGSDYATASGTLTFLPGETTQTVTVLVTGDTVFETDQSFFVNLSGPTNATIADGQGVGTITNDDAAPTLSIDDASVNEADGTITFTVTRTGATELDVQYDVATDDDIAVSGTAGPGTPDFGDRQLLGESIPASLAATATRTFVVNVVDDNVFEVAEQFFATLSNAVNATISDGQGVGTIVNDDPLPTVGIGDVSVNEADGTATFTVTLTGASALPFSVDYATADGTAVSAGSATPGTPDYAQKTGTLMFPASASTTQTLTVMVSLTNDATNEPAEQFVVNLSNPSNSASIADGQGVATITDDDPVPTLSIDDVTGAEGNSGPTSYTFNVTLSAASAQVVTVTFATADGTALVGSDYAAAAGILTFFPGEITKTVTVLITGDNTFEADETFLVNLSGPTNATIDDGQGVGTITNDDPAPAVTLSLTGSLFAEAGGTATVTATLSNPSALPVVVTLGFTGTAAGSDYTTSDTVITIPAGSLSGSITLTGVDDTADETDETVIVDVTAVTDGTESGTQQVTATVTDDDLPVAAADALTTNEDASLTAPSVLGNDNAAPGSTAELVGAGPTNGTLTLNADGTVTYTPATDFNGTDSFQYQIRNAANELSAPVTVTLTVAAVNDAPAFTAGPNQTVGRGGDPVTVTGWATGISAGPADESTQALTFVVTTDNDALFAVPPAIDPATGTLAFTPTATGFGTATVTVRLTDDGGTANGGANASATQTFTITVTRHATGDDTAVDPTEFPIFAVGSDAGGPVALYNPDGSVASTTAPFAPGVGGRVVLADVTGDGAVDTVAGTAPGVPARLLVVDPATGRTVLSAFPFGADFTGGLYVAAGDVNADGRADVIVSADATGGARVVVYDGATGAVVASFLGIDDPAFRGGARVAVGDVNGDGVGDVVVAAGLGGGPRVAVFDGTTVRAGSAPQRLIGDFFAFEQTLRDGAFVAAGDLNGDGFADLVFGGGPGGAPRVLAFDGQALFGPPAGAGQFVALTSFFAADSALRFGIQVAVKNADGDGLGDLVTAAVTLTGSEVRLILGKDLTPTGGAATTDLDLFQGLTSGVFVG